MDRSRTYAWTVVASSGVVFTWQMLTSGGDSPALTTWLFWIALLAAIDLLPVSLGYGTEVTMAFPVDLALAILFRNQPWVAMSIRWIAAFDLREIRREIPLHRSLFNRCEQMLAVGASALPFALFAQGGTPYRIDLIVASALLHLLVNLGLVALALRFERGMKLSEFLGAFIPKPITGFAVSYILLAGLGTATALAHDEIGKWAVAAMIIPLLFARLSILGAQAQAKLSEKVRQQQEALLEATEKVFQEREQERNRIAEDIHDSSLQMLAAASYGCANASEFLNAGLPDAARDAVNTSRQAIEDAMTKLRESLVDLRKSSVEEGGLVETISNFADQMGTLWGTEIVIEATVDHEPPTPVALAAFQILQEGLVNALKHAQTGDIVVRISDSEGQVHIVVEDKGAGFDTGGEVGQDHVGMRLMHERAARVGGRIELQSQPGTGTRLEAILPGGLAT